MVEIGIAQLVQGSATGLSTLKAAQVAALQVLIGSNPTRFYPDTPPENTAYPCATYRVISDVPDYVLSGASAVQVMRLQVDARSGGTTGASALSAKTVALKIRDLLAGAPAIGGTAALPCFTGTLPDGSIVAGIFIAGAHSGFDQDAREYVASADYRIHFYPAAG